LNTILAALIPTRYTGHGASLIFLGLCGVLTLVPGLIHHFLRDGGAESIAGLKLGDQRELVVGVFAWLGATQVSWGLLILTVPTCCQHLAPLVLLLLLLERSLLVFRWWVRGRGTVHRPPEHYASLVLLPLAFIFFLLALPASV
jgi:hypothetical protein